MQSIKNLYEWRNRILADSWMIIKNVSRARFIAETKRKKELVTTEEQEQEKSGSTQNKNKNKNILY